LPQFFSKKRGKNYLKYYYTVYKMTELKCLFCDAIFSTKYILQKHQNTAKFCLEIQNKTIELKYKCDTCDKTFIRKDFLERHISSCKNNIKKQILELNENIDKANKTIDKLKKNNEKLKLENKNQNEQNKYLDKANKDYLNRINSLEIQLKEFLELNTKSMENVASKAIENTGSKTTNQTFNNRNQIISNLQPLTNDYMRDQTQHFGVDYIRHGAQSMALFAKDYTFKNRIAITDVSRKKFVFKDEQGNLISDFNGIRITDKFLETNREVIEKSCNEYLCILDYKMDIYNAKNDNERLEQAEMEHFLTTKLLNTILNKDNPDNIKNMEQIKSEFINHLIKIFEMIEKENEEKDSISFSNDD
jgi:hypothetical protein